MSWVRAVAVLAALGVHAAGALFLISSAPESNLNALQSGNGRDDLTVAATVTLQSEESIGLDAVNAEHQEASAPAQAAPKPEPQKQQEVKKEEAIEMTPPPPVESAPPQAPIQEKPPEKKEEVVKQEVQPTSPSVAALAQEEQRAMSRDLEARRSQLISLYNTRVYQALMKHALRPKAVTRGRVIVELTLSPSGQLLAHRVVQSSGYDMLDRTALASLERAAPFPPAPPELINEPHTLRVPFDYAVK